MIQEAACNTMSDTMITTAKSAIILDPARRYHFLAIGGIGMSALAQILLARGYRVSGCDAKETPMLARLRAAGAEVAVGHDPAHLQAGDIIIVSDAIKPENAELQHARARQFPIYMRADLLGHLTNSGQGVAVSGTHGKTTTSGMLACILIEAGLDPTCILGGELSMLQSNARAGGALVLVEACEAYDAFLDLRPEVALLTNIEVDHLDHHGTPEHLYESFRQFLRQVKRLAVLNGDDALLVSMREFPPSALTYGLHAGNDYRIRDVELGAAPSFLLTRHGEELGRIVLRVPGLHNVSNAAGAAATAVELGAPMDAVTRGLAAFPGMHRRFEQLGQHGGVTIIDDYAHHPTEVRATLAAARTAFPGRIIAVFQPHLFSRTRDLLEEFAGAFVDADLLLIAPIYPARELPIPGVSHQHLAARAQAVMPPGSVVSLSSLEEATTLLRTAFPAHATAASLPFAPLHAGDVIITLGAGDVDTVAQALADSLRISC